MKFRSDPGASPYRLTLENPMTIDFHQELEQSIIYAMRCHTNLEADLSGVQEIDHYGIRLLSLLRSIGTLVAVSPMVAEACNTSDRGDWLGNEVILNGGNLR